MTLSPAVLSSAAENSAPQLWLLTARYIVRSDGIAGLFVGTAARFAEVVPGTVAYWVAAEALERLLTPLTAPG